MTWKMKTFFDKCVDNFYKLEKIELEKNKVYLDMAVAYYNVWAYRVIHGPDEESIALQEYFIKDEVIKQWGECIFEIDRIALRFVVRGRDGRVMNLKTGDTV